MKFRVGVAFLAQLPFPTSAPAQTRTPGADGESWSNAIQAAVSLGRRGDFRQALQSYEQLLPMPPISSNFELRARVLIRMADTEIELGEYAEAEARA
jgi:hypothetical protein